MTQGVFVDTSAFFSLQDRGNLAEHEIAGEVARELSANGSLLVTTDYILDETFTLLRMSLGHKLAIAFGETNSRERN